MAGREFHALAGYFPLLDGPGFDALIADIKVNGLREPIMLYEGAVLDGRNRMRACECAGVEPKFVQYTGTDPLAFVISANVHRRHLTDSQRAMAAARAETTKHGGNRKPADQGANWHLDRKATAKAFGAKTRTVARAAAVLARGVPELAAAVDQGQLKISKAAIVARLTPEKQRAWLADPKAVRVKPARQVPGLSQGALPDLADLDEPLKTTAEWYWRGLAVGIHWLEMRGPGGKEVSLEAAELFKPLIEHREKLVLADRIAAAVVQAAGLDELRRLGRGLESANDWAEVGTLLRDRLLAHDSAPATDYIAIRERWASLNPKQAAERTARRYSGSKCELWAAVENYCRVQYIGEELDALATTYAFSRVVRELNRPAREAAQLEAEAAAKKAKRDRRDRRLSALN